MFPFLFFWFYQYNASTEITNENYYSYRSEVYNRMSYSSLPHEKKPVRKQRFSQPAAPTTFKQNGTDFRSDGGFSSKHRKKEQPEMQGEAKKEVDCSLAVTRRARSKSFDERALFRIKNKKVYQYDGEETEGEDVDL